MTTHEQPNNPLHGITLENMLKALVAHYEWTGLGARIDIRCFAQDPSISSSLKFLRKTPWARAKVEKLYVEMKSPGVKGSADTGLTTDDIMRLTRGE